MSGRGTRRRSVMPAPTAAPVAPKGRVGRPSKTATKAVPKNAAADSSDAFVSSSSFNFEMPMSPKGPMTRARRSSIYVGGATNRRATAATSRTMPVVKEEKKPSAPRGRPRIAVAPAVAAAKASVTVLAKTPSPARLSTKRAASVRKSTRKTATKAKKTISTPTALAQVEETFPQLRLTPSPLRNPAVDPKIMSDVRIVLNRLDGSPIKRTAQNDAAAVGGALESVADSPKRVDIVVEEMIKKATSASPRKVSASGSSPMPGTMRGTRSTKKVVPVVPATRKVFAPATKKSSPKSMARPTGFPGTPQMADPISLLRGNLKNKVKAEMEEKVAKMPATSPYQLTEEENSDEEGSPRYTFTRISDRPPRSAKAAVKFMTTGTPGHAPAKARRILGAVSSNTPKRKLNMNAEEEEETEETVASLSPAKTPKIDASLNNGGENSAPTSPTMMQPQLVTGDLAKACVIM